MTGDKKITYTYLNPHSPAEKINYSYSKFKGGAFLLSYQKSRKDTINNIEQGCHENRMETVRNQGNTEKLFLKWISKLTKNEDIDKEIFDLLIKRFEVTKKIYINYDSEFRPINKDSFKDFGLYVLFAQVLTRAYKKYNKLQYLNSLLKVNDINISVWASIENKKKMILANCLKAELDFVANLEDKLK